MAFEYFPDQLTAVDGDTQLQIKPDFTFYDETSSRVCLTDLVSGQSWTFPITEERVEHAVAHGPFKDQTIQTAGAYVLPRSKVEEIANELSQRRRQSSRPIERSDAVDAINDGMFVYLSHGGEMLKFVPSFHVDLR